MSRTHKLYRDGRYFDLASDPFETTPLARAAWSASATTEAKVLQAALDKFADARPAHLAQPGDGPGGKGKKKAGKNQKKEP